MHQRVIIFGTYWGTWKKHVGNFILNLRSMLGTHWACGWNNIIPKRKEFILFVG